MPRPRRSYARWRALSLSMVYVLFAAHILHWKITGKTLAPLELNEVMYTLELGIITAGFLFMCFLVLGTLVFGRFFCSWACHIMVLQDLCAWVLRKFRIRQKPVRSRLLLLVPPLTAFYMFVWPQVLRTWHSKTLPVFYFATDKEGWASFVTNNFWRNLPGPAIIIVTFLVCGIVLVYLMGSRTFCTYVCPYGAIFALADRFSPGRILVSNKCQQCGTCTAACTSGIRVHEEVKQHGMIVNPACLKDLDCVSACPQGALGYTFARPALLKSRRSGGRFGSLPYDFSLREELLIGMVFLLVLLSFRGLYSRIPFLLSLALGGILGYLTVLTIRLAARPNVSLSTLRLKSLGKLTPVGTLFVGLFTVLAAFVAHSAFVRYHEYLGLKQAIVFDAQKTDQADELAASAYAHLLTADRWGLLRNVRVERSALTFSSYLQRFDDVEKWALRVLEHFPDDLGVRIQLGQALAGQHRESEARQVFFDVTHIWHGEPDNAPPAVVAAHLALGGMLARQGDFVSAARHLYSTVRLDPNRAEALAELGGVLAELGHFDEAIASLTQATLLNPKSGGAHYNLGTILGHLGRFDEAIPSFEQAMAYSPDDAELNNNLGFAYLRTGRFDLSRQHLQRAVEINPQNADAHFNLGTLFTTREQTEQASEHYRIAASLDPRYARILGDSHSD